MSSETSKENLAKRQLAFLERKAEETGRWRDLLYFHAIRGDHVEGRALADAARGGHAEDQLAYHLLFSERQMPSGDRLLGLAEGTLDPWLFYTVTKHFLAERDTTKALKAQLLTKQRGIPNFLGLNLIARTAWSRGDWPVAEEAVRISLKGAPEQRDMQRLQEAVAKRIPGPPESYLGLLPKPATVAYYLPCYNVERFLDKTIEGILNQNHPIHELLIVDDASPDASRAIAARYPTRILCHEENRGLAAARNTAWRAANAAYVASVDTDAIPEPNYLQCAMMEFEQGPDRLAGVGGRLVEAYTDTPQDAWRNQFMCQDPGSSRWCVGGEKAGFDPHETHFITGSNTVLLRKAIEDVGGYDERRRTNAEDFDLCKRLRMKGWHYAFSPWCAATHFRRDTVPSVLRTAWNYAFWAWEEIGCYASFPDFFGLLTSYLRRGQQMLALDLAQQHPDLVYLDFLYIVHSMCLDLRHVVGKGLLAPGQALLVQKAIMEEVAALDRRCAGGAFQDAVRADLEHVLFPEGEARRFLDPGADQAFRSFIGELRRAFSGYSEEMCHALLQGAQALERV